MGNMLQIIFYGIGKILFHVIFIKRLHMTFQGIPSLKYPDYVFGCLYIALFLAVAIIAFILFVLIMSQNDQLAFISIGAFCGDFVLSIFILLLFIKKLHKVFIQRKMSSVKDVNRPIKFQKVDLQMIGTMIKLTLLSCLNATSSLFLLSLFIIRGAQSSSGIVWKSIYAANIFFMISGMV